MELDLPSVEVQDDQACVRERDLGGVHLRVEVDDCLVGKGLLNVALRKRVDDEPILENFSPPAVVEFPLD